MTDEQYMEEFVNNLKKMIQNEVSNIKTTDTAETTVLSITPLSIQVGNLSISSEFIKVVNNVHLEPGNKVLVIRSKDKQKYYIMGVIQ